MRRGGQGHGVVRFEPLLLQHITSDYGPISIITAGNQIRGAKGMKAAVEIDNVHLDGNDQSKGTIGVLDAAVTWPANGVTKSVQDAIPLLRSVVSGARTHPSDGTIELRGALGSSIIVKPQVVNNAISLQVVGLTALGLTLPRAGVQSELDAFTNQLAKNLPLGIHADTVQVTDDGVAAHFSTHSASIVRATAVGTAAARARRAFAAGLGDDDGDNPFAG